MVFDFVHYEKLVSKIVDSGYMFADYENFETVQNPCIIRHDVDFSLKKAARFAEFESGLMNGKGLKSTYFVLLSTDFYNVFTKENRAYLEKIVASGHTVGLHFDEMQYDLSGDIALITEKILEESHILSTVLGMPVKTVSMHRPSKAILEQNLSIPNMVNSYSDVFFHAFKYLSDSRMHWREDPMEAVGSRNFEKLHILTHPIWYDGGTLNQRLCAFINDAKFERYDLLNQNFRALETEVKREEI